MAVSTRNRQVSGPSFVLTASPLNRWKNKAWRGLLGLAVISTESGLVQGPAPSLQTPFVAQVRSRHCDVKTKFITHVPCTTCPAAKKQVCPSGWLQNFPKKISQDCRCGSPPLSLPTSGSILWGVREPGRAWKSWEVRAGTRLFIHLLAPPVGRREEVGKE